MAMMLCPGVLTEPTRGDLHCSLDQECEVAELVLEYIVTGDELTAQRVRAAHNA